ncbi:MAG: right-handed parallel beta-helix repeat-containing protein, partial [bacterium]|nr:right-handed parallel beta-helix repeat-containing protein [bacterium]
MKRNLVKVFSLCLFLCFNIFLVPRLVQASDPAIQCINPACHSTVHALSAANHQGMISDRYHSGVGGCPGCHSNLHPVSYPTPSALTSICSSCHPNNGVTHPGSATTNPVVLCGNCHYAHKATDSVKTQISQAIHERIIMDSTYFGVGFTECAGCHKLPPADIYPTPLELANICAACHPNNGIAPVSTIINAGLPNGCYTKIQTAVDLTTPGKTINVLPGTYNENVLVNKTLTLIGAGSDSVFVKALDSTDDVFEIAADSVNISGFNINGSTGTNKSGIYVNGYSGANNSNVSQNKISGNYLGIFAVNSNNSVFDNNNLYDNLWGLYANPVTNSKISNNIADSNTNIGINLINGSVNNLLKGNAVSNNTGTGIVLRMNCSNNTLVDNIIFNNGTGLNLNIMSFAPDANNVIYHNNFIGNGTPVTDNNPADNKYYDLSLLEGNYWSNYNGDDDGSGTGKHAIAGDGIGDSLTPHPAEFFDLYPVTVQNGWLNIQPILDPIGNKSVNENQLLQFTITGSDPDSGLLTYSAAGLPAGALFDGATFTWTPDYSQSGIYPVTFTVSDGSKSTSESITITVIDVSQPDLIMTALSTASTKVAPGSTLIVSNTAKNQGVTASGAFTIAFHLSQDTI